MILPALSLLAVWAQAAVIANYGDAISAHGLIIDIERHTVSVKGQPVTLRLGQAADLIETVETLGYKLKE